MIPILYAPEETAFVSNGLGLLTEAASCEVEQELNGELELELTYPTNGKRFSDLAQRAIILATVDPTSDAQPFRIYRITTPHSGKVKAYAQHIAYDLKGVPVAPYSAASASDALNGLKTNAATDCPFSFWTDKSTAATMTVSEPTAAWSLLGGTEGGILDTYGGEYEFDRWTVKLHSQRGADRGVIIRYGKNLQTLEQDKNCANVCTGIYPFWASSEGDLVQLPEKIVNADGTYSFTRVIPVDFSSEWEEAPTEDQLRARAERYIKDNDIGTPTVSLEISFVNLDQTEEYKDKALLERVVLGDTVGVEFPLLGVSATARVVSAKWLPLLDRYDSVTLGKVKADIASTIVAQEKEVEKKPDMSTIQQKILALADIFTGVKGGAVRLLDTDGDGMPDELYIADNAEPDQAKKVWRFNYLGWAASSTGYSGPFSLGATLEDGILAEAVTAAKLVAGTIQSADGKSFYLDLDNSILKMSMSSDNITVDDEAVVTTTAMQSAISAASDSITLSVSKTLESYSTTEQMQSAISAAIEVSEGSITSTVSETYLTKTDAASTYTTESTVSSIIEQSADSIRLKASTIAWTSTYSSMTKDGVLTCTSAKLTGSLYCGNTSGYINITNGVIYTGDSNGQSIIRATRRFADSGKAELGLETDWLVFTPREALYIYDGDAAWYHGYTEWFGPLHFVNGIYVGHSGGYSGSFTLSTPSGASQTLVFSNGILI